MLKRLEMAIVKLVPSENEQHKKGFESPFFSSFSTRLDIKRFISQFQPLRKKFPLSAFIRSRFFHLTRYTREKKREQK
jgi:hypothetical protein